jgi:hypothetical protein
MSQGADDNRGSFDWAKAPYSVAPSSEGVPGMTRRGERIAKGLWLPALLGVLVVLALATACDGAPVASTVVGAVIPSDAQTLVYTPSLFPVKQGTKWGYIDSTGRLVIDFQYDEANDFCDGLAGVRVGDSWGYIDEDGRMVISPQLGTGSAFSDGRARILLSGEVGYMDKTGRVVIAPSLEWAKGNAQTFSEGLATAQRREGGYGYIDTTGALVLRLPGATAAGGFHEGLAGVRTKDGYGYISKRGLFVIQPRFTGATPFSNGRAVVEDGFFEFCIIDTSGRVLRRLDYGQVMGLAEGRASVCDSGPVELLTGESSETFEPLWGYIYGSGELVIPLKFTNASEFRGGLARVEDDSAKMAYIDLQGDYVWREK